MAKKLLKSELDFNSKIEARVLKRTDYEIHVRRFSRFERTSLSETYRKSPEEFQAVAMSKMFVHADGKPIFTSDEIMRIQDEDLANDLLDLYLEVAASYVKEKQDDEADIDAKKN